MSNKSIVRIGIIGTGDGIDAFRTYLQTARTIIEPGKNARGKYYDSLCFPDFPGANTSVTFRCEFTSEPSIQRSIPAHLFEQAVRANDVSTKLRQVIELVIRELETLSDAEPTPDIVAVIMPPIVEKECAAVGLELRKTKLVLTPGEKVERKLRKQQQKTGQDYFAFDFGDSAIQSKRGYWNFHHALKAHAMRYGLPTQLIWEPRLRGQGLTQDPASMAWNLFIEHHGDSTTQQICSELMALSKINWNSCSFASSDPITILFARTVGRILTELPKDVQPQTKYKFYM